MMKYVLVVWWALVAAIVMTLIHPVATEKEHEGTIAPMKIQTLCNFKFGRQPCPMI